MAVGKGEIGKIHAVAGVRLGAIESNIRYENRLDLVLIEIAAQSTVAGVFTQNAFCAAPVNICKEHLQEASSRYFLINTGNANAGTGQPGALAALDCCQAVADLCQVSSKEVLPFSTGVIGEALPKEKIISAVPRVFESLSEMNWLKAAQGILTTDTRPKIASTQIEIAGTTINITGMAKGSGMIKPNMATMLGFVFTDIEIDKPRLSELLSDSVAQSFNRLTVDGDTSTNDSCMLVATGKSGVKIDDASNEEANAFREALNSIFLELATGLIKDAEGATKFITIKVNQGVSFEECLLVAYTVAESPLVKTAFFASDPNWGRILAAVGRAGIENLNVEAITIDLGDVRVVSQGAVDASYTESSGQTEMDKDEILVEINLARGDATASVFTSDLSHDYVRINADYRS
ncbi:MAG: bifunctional ornithine acetyltransferase/N-acetylglutamate synthase [SAR86 cluster bacterium]|uniref:Arginine biosynthesis bifunctional protein ArgJ n=1 Tax=SAR86 cluster bacterium TaxID=2030880 RepID=A0A2A5AZ82_9GAMM|nr:MAG: bifunctional ornithine acetyltransferase/N-acetylglutamate synthase [SAR86 cluster bacterium]